MSKIAILTGGQSSEREIALLSAQFVEKQVSRFFKAAIFDFPKDLDRFVKIRRQYALAIPVFHGRGGEDGQIQGFLETLGVPYLFSGIAGHSVAMDKILTKVVAKSLKIKQPCATIVSYGNDVVFRHKVVVKPYDHGSSIAVRIANSQKELNDGLKTVWQYSDKALVEEFIKGEEYTASVIDQKGKPVALPIIWIKPKKSAFFDYENKYSNDGAQEICPAPISPKLAIKMQADALKIHQKLNLKHISRSDFIVKNDQPSFLEINTIPGLTKNSLVPKAVKAAGLDFGLLLKEWLEAELKNSVR